MSVTFDQSAQGGASAKVSAEGSNSFSVQLKPSAHATWELKNHTRTQCWTESVVKTMTMYPQLFVFSVDANGDLTWDLAQSASGHE